MNKRYIFLISTIVVSIYIYYIYDGSVSSSTIMTKHQPAATVSDSYNNEVLPIPDDFDELIVIKEQKPQIMPAPNNNLLAVNPFVDDVEFITEAHQEQPLAIDSNINLLTGSDLWKYRPTLKLHIEREQQILLTNDYSAMQVDDDLLKQLVVGDSLIVSLPNKGTQQIIISAIQKNKNNVVVWELQNTQRQNIGKITQIKAITEGSFITDSKQEYHLRTVNNKGWIASKEQLVNNNNQAIKKNKQPFSKRFLNENEEQ
ncbi:hypothetical protein [Photobacterium andalusiense]|uniref:Uncharacterized protein n=1 Tax=Photobacterium andalusiense TaxID=2204296 RepID=A0A1Y6M945_9GAMM|nr:hypothetical protein [Photobacterium andalusiense]SMY33055.1 hypothetical protein PAND9192_00743 [Photobacterium andalusiense]